MHESKDVNFILAISKVDIVNNTEETNNTEVSNNVGTNFSSPPNAVNKLKKEFNFKTIDNDSSDSSIQSISPDPELEHLDFLDDNIRVLILKIYHQKDNEER